MPQVYKILASGVLFLFLYSSFIIFKKPQIEKINIQQKVLQKQESIFKTLKPHQKNIQTLWRSLFPQSAVYVENQLFYMDKFEVSHQNWEDFSHWASQNQKYTEDGQPFVSHAKTDRIAGQLTAPVTGIRQIDAKRYCEFLNGFLPTQQQWEFAAKAGKNFYYSWGSDFNEQVAPFIGANLNSAQAIAQSVDINPGVWLA